MDGVPFLGLPPRTVLGVLPDYRPLTPDTPAKARERQRARERYWADPEKFRARRRVANLNRAQRERVRMLDRRKYRVRRDAILARLKAKRVSDPAWAEACRARCRVKNLTPAQIERRREYQRLYRARLRKLAERLS